MLKRFSASTLLASIALPLLSAWALSSASTGRPWGHDCGLWQIFTVNAFAPVGMLGVICSACSLWLDSWRPQWVLLAGVLAVVGWGWLNVYGFGNGLQHEVRQRYAAIGPLYASGRAWQIEPGPFAGEKHG